MLFLYSLHSCKINYLSNVLAPYEGGNKIGKVLKTSCQSPYLVFLHAMKLTHLALVGGDPKVLSSGLQVAV